MRYKEYVVKEKELKKKMKKLKIFEKDIKEEFVRSSGRGGQNVNKVSTCVSLVHIPTQIKVKCQKERQQNLNRLMARRILVDKIERMYKDEILHQAQIKYKNKKQVRKRPKPIKEEVLRKKHIQSEKKAMRKKITSFDNDVD